MKRNILVKAFFQALVLLAPVLSFAQVIRAPVREQVFKNENCEATDSCDLKEFKIGINEYQVRFKVGTSYGTDAKVSYRTDKVETLEKYAIVQYIRGCKFHTMKMPDQSIAIFGMVREAFGGKIPFYHKEWDVDTIDEDPIYNSGPVDKRHGYYRWDKDGEKEYYITEKPKEPSLYVTDLPGTASMANPDDISSNISLEFQTCIYKTADLPLSVKENGGVLPGALKCFEWNSSYIYDHETAKFSSPKGLYCPLK